VTDAPLLSLLGPAVGGQGGGVLLDWIVDAALVDGYPVHGTSIPGVAQRTGSTTYYVELSGERNPAADGTPIFSLYPVPGALDVLLAPEFLEVGRSTSWLPVAGPDDDHRQHPSALLDPREDRDRHGITRSRSPVRRTRLFEEAHAFDALALAREHGTEANAVPPGALAGSGVPRSAGEEAYREAIRAKGAQVDATCGFDVGLAWRRRFGARGGAWLEPPSP
jgi:indolepyruvate ferredoxin oxidoreductase beta subunit